MSVVFSYLSLFVVLNVLFDSVVHAAFSFRPPNSTCVWTERQLRKVIEKATNQTRTKITLCRQTISISNETNQYKTTGIDLTDRFVDIRCYLKRSKGLCKLDGGQNARIFIGERSDLTVRNVVFTNAKPYDCGFGGAIKLFSSNLTMTGCSFMNNGKECNIGGNAGGGAIYVLQSMLKINGGSKKRPVWFSENESNAGGALYLFDSKASIEGYTVFSNNSGVYTGAVDLVSSTFDIKNVRFQENFSFLSGSALSSEASQVNMTNVDFIGNVGKFSVNYYLRTSLFATNCSFADNNSTVFEAEDSKITLKNSTFSNNTSYEYSSNIYIRDDRDPSENGTFVECESNVVFCNGLGVDSIDEFSFDNTFGKFSNTDCNTEGLQGTPGQGSCPM